MDLRPRRHERCSNAETAQAMSFPIIAPLVFASSAFVPVATMPTWLQGFAEHQPVSVTVNAARGLLLGTAETSTVIAAIAWSVGIVAVFAPSRCAGTAGPPERVVGQTGVCW
ncbi:MAG: ABC transporter permease [Microthrixaceae bacterium]